jgi:L,D-peptidoglycan transpeptidase YkuD (ErfK/YbiS/YcfS/YnhG family)
MTAFPLGRALLFLSVAAVGGCAAAPAVASQPSTAARAASTPLVGARQMVLVVTPDWDSTSGTLRRYVRASDTGAWRAVGAAVPIVVGRTGVAWDDSQVQPAAGEPVKREGDGRSPAGAFALDTAFGFDIRQIASWVRLPYVQLRTTTECVDDDRSVHYNTIVNRDSVARVDWSSSERMREIEQYAYGVHVAYNAPPRPSRGSCIFLHIWGGPRSVTAGCTAMEQSALKTLIAWIDGKQRPMLVQLPASAVRRLREEWRLP